MLQTKLSAAVVDGWVDVGLDKVEFSDWKDSGGPGSQAMVATGLFSRFNY